MKSPREKEKDIERKDKNSKRKTNLMKIKHIQKMHRSESVLVEP